MIALAVVGSGRWGPNLVRNFSQVPDCTVRWVCDVDATRARAAAGRVGAGWSTRIEEVLVDVDAVAIATPPSTHAQLASLCLHADRHVLVEKPLTTSLVEAVALAELASQRGLVLACDHTYCYHPTVVRLRALVRDGALGELQRITSTRVNCGDAQPAIDVFWDLAHHDLAILDHVLPPGSRLVSVEARGVDPRGIGRSSGGELHLRVEGGVDAGITVDWFAPGKVRTMRFDGARASVSWDDLVMPRELVLDGQALPVDATDEALHGVALEFVAAVTQSRPPVTDIAAELRVLGALEAARRSLAAGGEPMPVAEGAA